MKILDDHVNLNMKIDYIANPNLFLYFLENIINLACQFYLSTREMLFRQKLDIN
jgi:hypothetical protein